MFQKHAGEHPCRSVISIKLLRNFIEIRLWHGCSPVNLLYILGTHFPRKTSELLLLLTLNLKNIANMFIWRLMQVQFRLFFHRRAVLVELTIVKNYPKTVWNSSSSEIFANFLRKNLWCCPIVQSTTLLKKDFNIVALLGSCIMF